MATEIAAPSHSGTLGPRHHGSLQKMQKVTIALIRTTQAGKPYFIITSYPAP